LLCVPKYDLLWRKFQASQKRMCIAWLLGEILCRYLLCLFCLMCGVIMKFLFWSFAKMTYLLVIAGHLDLPHCVRINLCS
jgi:hypothetical protein